MSKYTVANILVQCEGYFIFVSKEDLKILGDCAKIIKVCKLIKEIPNENQGDNN